VSAIGATWFDGIEKCFLFYVSEFTTGRKGISDTEVTMRHVVSQIGVDALSTFTIRRLARTVTRKFSIGGLCGSASELCVFFGSLDIIKLTKTPLIYSVSRFNLGGLGALLGGLSPPKPPLGDGTVSRSMIDTPIMLDKSTNYTLWFPTEAFWYVVKQWPARKFS